MRVGCFRSEGVSGNTFSVPLGITHVANTETVLQYVILYALYDIYN